MAEWILPTGEELEVPDELNDDQAALDAVVRDYMSSEATENSIIGALHRANRGADRT